MPSSETSSTDRWVVDGNGAAVDCAYRLNELCALYPITPSSPMGEQADVWRAQGRENLWGTVPGIVEMQSEAGAAATLHGALQAGSLATTFTSSQGLLLMIPTMHKLAGECCPCVIHVAARAIASHALSIFGDHSDVMATRSSGFAMLFASSVQEAHDFALIAQAASLTSRIPFLHIFDGFRTSHELRPVSPLPDTVLKALVPEALIQSHRERGLTPDAPVIRGTSQNPDTFFQGRERANTLYKDLPDQVSELFKQLADLTGRTYQLVEYTGHPEAETVVVLMGSASETARDVVQQASERGERIGALSLRLYRPWPTEAVLAALPDSVTTVMTLDRTKEAGSVGEPLALDMAATLQSHRPGVRLLAGRYGLGGKEFTPAMVQAVFNEARSAAPRARFCVGINDDLTQLSLDVPTDMIQEDPETTRALFYGLGSDGTVSANKNTLHILGQKTDLHAQGYFVYDSNKSGSRTVSHLRFGPNPIRAPYLIQSASFIAVHCFSFVHRYDLLTQAEKGATLLFNSPHSPETLLSRLPQDMLARIRELTLKVFTIDAARVAADCGLGRRINTVMQTCFFTLSKLLDRDEALEAIRQEIRHSYGRKGRAIEEANLKAVDAACTELNAVPIPDIWPETPPRPLPVPDWAPEFEQKVTSALLKEEGDRLPVSAMPLDGSWPVSTSHWNQRDLSDTAPVWDPDLCIQCGHCVVICPHGVIQVKQAHQTDLKDAPDTFPSSPLRGGEPDDHYLLQLNLPQCTGCGLCIELCPAKSKTKSNQKALMPADKAPRLETEATHLAFFQSVPARHGQTQHRTLRGVQYLPQRFEFPGACAGCGETGALKLISQLYGDRMLVANATGCSSIYGGNLPTTPWTVDENGRGPAWANSLFEDNAEFGLGFRLAVDRKRLQAEELLQEWVIEGLISSDSANDLLHAQPETASEMAAQRERLKELDAHLLREGHEARLKAFRPVADALVPRSVWIVGGDGWACDIGFGGVDHVLSGGHNVNLLVLDTEVYSNTGGQASKSTPLGAIAKFAAGGKTTRKTDLALHAILKGNVYVGTIALGAKLPQALRTIQEAEAWPGPSLILAYSPCIAHGYPLERSLDQQQKAVLSGHWPLFRYNPALRQEGRPALMMDSPDEPAISLKSYTENELRYTLLDLQNPEQARSLLKEAETGIQERMRLLKLFAGNPADTPTNDS